MEGFKGTPGEWVHHDASGYQHSMGGYILGREGKICDVSGFDVGSGAAKANASLIAAAPELLEALQSLLATQILPDFHAEKFRRVVAKALGQ